MQPSSGECGCCHSAKTQERSWHQPGSFALGLAACLALAAELVHWRNPELEPLVILLALAAVCLSGFTTYRKGWSALRQGNFNINALMTLAVSGALLIGEWPEAAMVMVLFTLAERLESASMARARGAIRELMALAPDRARIAVDGVIGSDAGWQLVAVEEVAPGQRIQVRPGEKIPLDGFILRGAAAINEAPVTGESMPADKSVGDRVYAGTLNETGLLELQVTSEAGNSTIARIIHAVEKAQSERAPMQRFIDRFARRYTPAVLLIALATALLLPLIAGWSWQEAFYRALVLLVIACPCALVISTPVTLASGLARAARQGVLVKGGRYLELGQALKAVALDKTGTLTEGKPRVRSFESLVAGDSRELLEIAGALSAHSDHPASRAVKAYVSRTVAELTPAASEHLRVHTGLGLEGEIGGKRYWLGRAHLLAERGLDLSAVDSLLAAIATRGESPLLLADQARVLAVFALGDLAKAHSHRALEQLHALDVHTVILSGDAHSSVASLADELGVTQAQAGLLPELKLGALQELRARYGPVAMVGDGINDAPALAGADIGFAMGVMGTDVALETADVAIMDDNLQKIPWFIRHSRATLNILRQNIALALGIKLVFILLALMGAATLWMAVFADLGASLLVIFNGLRLLGSSSN